MNKTIQEKLFVSLLLVILMINFMASNFSISLADEEMTGWQKLENGIVVFVDVLEDGLNVVMGSVVGLLTKPFRALALSLADGLDDIIADLAYSQGTMNPDGTIRPDTFLRDIKEGAAGLAETLTLGAATFKPSVTPFDILFNKLAIVDIDFFDIPKEVAGQGSIIRNMRLSIASWYYIMRNIAAVILLCVLIYVGIRMAISTVASDKAAYKKMLVDWVCSLALIFLVQYIIIFTITVNEALVSSLQDLSGKDGATLTKSIQSIKMTAKNWFTLDSIAATVVYCMLIGQTLSLLLSYFNRMLKVAFLIIISPLITLTYSMDKMGDGKAQALGTWLKEFVYTVLIQSFHCIIYMVFIKMAVSILDSGLAESYNLAGSFLAVMCIKFTKDAEKILGKIFKFGDSTSDTSLAVGMALSAAAFSKAGSIGKGTVKAVNGVRSFAHNATAFAHTYRVSKEAVKQRKAAREEGREMSMEEATAIAEEKVSLAEAKKAERKADVSYPVGEPKTEAQKKYAEAVNEAAEKYKKAGLTDTAAKARARTDIARQKKRDESRSPIARARGRIKPYADLMRDVRSTEAYKQLAGVARGYAATGAALFLGATAYGMNGDAIKSLALGGAGFKGTQEIFKNSSTTMIDSAQSILEGMGKANEGEAIAEMQVTQSMGDILENDDKLDEQLEGILSFVKNALADAGLDADDEQGKKMRAAMKATMKREIKKNPAISQDDLLKKVESELKANPNFTEKYTSAVAGSSEFEGKVKDAAMLTRRKELYDTMQNASDLNLDPGTFAGMVGKRFAGGTPKYNFVPDTEERREAKRRVEIEESEFEASKAEFDPTVMSRSQQKEEIEYQYDRAMAAQEARSEVMDMDSAAAKALYEELLQQLKDEAETITEERKREIQSDLKDLREMLMKDLADQQHEYECSAMMNRRGKTEVRKVTYLTNESAQKAQQVIDEINATMNELSSEE